MDEKYISSLKKTEESVSKPGIFFRGTFKIETKGDSYIDFTSYTKGIIWINGHNLGRYWNIGPQKRLYCPAEWLKTGINEILIFDIHQTEARPVKGFKVLE
jgi:beta-galactosidase